MKFTEAIKVLLLLALLVPAWAQPERPIRVRPEKKEPETQALEVPQDPPAAIAAETARLVFHVSPLSGKGLLSQQIRDALKAIDKANGNGTLVKIRAFVAGTGDLRRVQSIVAEDFADRRRPLPAISTIQAGALPMAGAQVVIESVSEDRKVQNPNGLVFLSTMNKDPRAALSALRDSATKAGAQGMLRITCFLDSLDGVNAARQEAERAFPGASLNFVQLTRLGVEPLASCESVGRLAKRPPGALEHGMGVVAVNTPKLVFTGVQMAFQADDAGLRLAYERLRKSMEASGAKDAVFVSSYSLTKAVAERGQMLQADNFGPAIGSSLVFEGLPSLDATAAVEAVGAVR